MWLDLEIYKYFKDGGRIEFESYCSRGDENIYLDEKLVRIYYVHRNKPKKQRKLCDVVSSIIRENELDEIEVAEAIVEFIRTYPCLWHFKDFLKSFENGE